MRIKLKANVQGQIYLPKLLRDEWGNEYVLVPNNSGGFFFKSGMSARQALKSLKVVEVDLEHQAEMEETSQKEAES